ncbi:MAG: hypothetical protein JST58_06330 [Bacteroidetes bacterium]|nr:hypothetical protein [Bacteroidota bacterium]
MDMKKILLPVLGVLIGVAGFAQSKDTLDTGKSVREKVLADIQSTLEKKTKAIDSTMLKLDQKVDSLDLSIRVTSNAREKADKLFDRVQALEDKQKAIEQNELNIFQANYQAAVVNLVYMDREIKPVVLFKTSKEFFELLTETTNPTYYPGYNDWYKQFHEFVEKNKKSSVSLTVFSNMVNYTSTVASSIPLGGPVTVLFFSGLETYINSLGKKKKELRDQSEKMFELTAKLSQFVHDKSDVEHDWQTITKELSEMHTHYDTVLYQNLKSLGISPEEFDQRFNKESDAEKRYAYITEIRKKASELVASQKALQPKDWKENIYFSLMDVQSLKLRFGQITFRMSENMDEYQQLLKKYAKDPVIGEKVSTLQKKLNELKEVFDNAFNPLDYLHSATRMYKVT